VTDADIFAERMMAELLVPPPGWDRDVCANDRGGATHPQEPDPPGAAASCRRCRSVVVVGTGPLRYVSARATRDGRAIGWPIHHCVPRPVVTLSYGAPVWGE
jgi:hypothetical protein